MNPAVSSTTALPTTESYGTARSVREWAITTTTGEKVSGYLPSWAAEDPSEADVPPEALAARLADVCHYREFPGQVLRAYSPGNASDASEELEIMSSSITCTPYAPAPESVMPVVDVRVAGEYWMTDLDPAGVADLVAGLRTVADRLDGVVIPQLNTLRAEWAAHHVSGAGACP